MSDSTTPQDGKAMSPASAGSRWRLAEIASFGDAATLAGAYLCIVGLFWVLTSYSMMIGDMAAKHIHSCSAAAVKNEDSVMDTAEIPFAWAITANGRFIESHDTKDRAMLAVTARESQMAMIEGVPCEADGTPVDHEVIPLYRSPKLTLEERDAVSQAK